MANVEKANAAVPRPPNTKEAITGRRNFRLPFSPLKTKAMIGIGYRKDFGSSFLESGALKPDFIELAPENWMGVGGYWKKQLRQVLERYPVYTHGLSLSVGSPEPPDLEFLGRIKSFLQDTGAQLYSEHLSYSKCDNAHLYDLLPIPFTEEAVNHVSRNIRQVQDFLEQKLVIEIVSYYTPVAPQLTELEFINAVLEESGCDLLLDVNNVFVNAFNHHYDAREFIAQLPLDRVRYIHMAGHEQVSEDLIIDTHGEAIIDPVYELFADTLRLLDREVPVLLERDFNIPELEALQLEIERLRHIYTTTLKSNRYEYVQ